MPALKRNECRRASMGLRSRWVHALGAASVVMAIAMPGLAQEMPISDIPLYISTQVHPNIMLVLDNSGSMSNVVPDTPYDVNGDYSCTGTEVNTDYSIDIYILDSGIPYFKRSSTYYDWGTGSGNGATTRPKMCFAAGSSYAARLHGNGGGATATKYPSSYLDAQYTGHYLNWYFGTNTSNVYGAQASSFGTHARIKPGTQSRLMIAKSAAKSLVDSLSSNVRIGLASYNGSDGGSLKEIIGDLTSSKRTDIKSKIDALSATGMTPLAETLADIGRYFTTGYTGSLILHPGQGNESTASVADVFRVDNIQNGSGQTISEPIQYSCQKSFVVYLTDGRPQADREIKASLRDYTGDCAAGLCVAASNTTNLPTTPLTAITYGNGTKIGRSYETQGSDYLDDVAQALYEMDLRPDLVDAHGARNNVVTYMIGFADDQAKNDPLMRDASDQAGGDFFTAGNESELVEAFLNAAQSILGSVATAASIATNTTRLGTDTRIYQAKFNSADWSGQLVAYVVNPDGTVGNEQWDSDDTGKIPAHGSRHIYTWNGSSGQDFTVNAWDDDLLASDQKIALQAGGSVQAGKDRLNWLRGDSSKEQRTPPGSLRNRTKLLGDIVNSDPAFVGKSNFRYDRLPVGIAGQSSYSAFLAGTTTRRKMLYVGANDGMLHAFDAETGVEQFAYIPKAVFSNLAGLTNPDYTHKYFVDGSPYIGDAYINGRWKTVLVGSTGAGGRSVFALDVSYLNLNVETYEPNDNYFDKTKVLWEFTNPDPDHYDANGDGYDDDLGYTIGQPVVGRMKTGQWVAIFGNGYKSDNHSAVLFIVDLETGALIKRIDTGAVGTSVAPNGLATPALLADSNRTIEYAYAGDLLGNLWKFNLTHASNVSQWVVAFTQGSNKYPLFQARNDAGEIQPITAPLEILAHGSGGNLVLFGTGKYFEVGDNIVDANPPVQSFYGIRDPGTLTQADVPLNRSGLQEQEITHELTAFNREVRVTTDNHVNYTTQKGWYMDLVSPINSSEGERVVSAPLIRSGRIIFTTLIPSPDPCEYGGTSWLMELDALEGIPLGDSVFDLNGDHLFNQADWVTVTINGQEKSVPVCGLKSEVGIIKTPAVISAGEIEYKFFGGSTGAIETVTEVGNAQSGRQSWRQLR